MRESDSGGHEGQGGGRLGPPPAPLCEEEWGEGQVNKGMWFR